MEESRNGVRSRRISVGFHCDSLLCGRKSSTSAPKIDYGKPVFHFIIFDNREESIRKYLYNLQFLPLPFAKRFFRRHLILSLFIKSQLNGSNTALQCYKILESRSVSVCASLSCVCVCFVMNIAAGVFFLRWQLFDYKCSAALH